MKLNSPEGKIKQAFFAGIFSGLVTILFSLLGHFNIINIGLGLDGLIDATIVFVLSFGIYKKSRICAFLLFTYFILSKLAIYIDMQKVPSGVAFVIAYCYLQGIIGTVHYHRKNKNSTQETAEKPELLEFESIQLNKSNTD